VETYSAPETFCVKQKAFLRRNKFKQIDGEYFFPNPFLGANF